LKTLSCVRNAPIEITAPEGVQYQDWDHHAPWADAELGAMQPEVEVDTERAAAKA
jgi:hypothetical protein